LSFKETEKIGETKNPHGNTKYIIERILIDLIKYDKRWSVRIARYFNLISNHSTGLIKANPKMLHLTWPLIFLSLLKKKYQS
jgi:UDP-glucose 4-epimerase